MTSVFRFHTSLFIFDQKTIVIFSNAKQQKIRRKAVSGRIERETIRALPRKGTLLSCENKQRTEKIN